MIACIPIKVIQSPHNPALHIKNTETSSNTHLDSNQVEFTSAMVVDDELIGRKIIEGYFRKNSKASKNHQMEMRQSKNTKT